MRSIKIFALAAVLISVVLGSTAFIRLNHVKKVKADNKGFAVIELFTSEGCSSCPPADDLVARIEKEDANKPVYILAFHVDYWNRLGWKDVFSSADYSRRQSEYANYLHLQSVYTPQIVVNGKTEFVGSEEGTLRNAIKSSLQQPAPAQLSLTVSAVNQNEASLKYNAEGAINNTELLIAVLQKNAQTKVERGENGGRTLSHVQIVRKLQRVVVGNGNGSVNVSLPNGFDAKGWEIIGILQNTRNGEIAGAAKAVMPTANI